MLEFPELKFHVFVSHLIRVLETNLGPLEEQLLAAESSPQPPSCFNQSTKFCLKTHLVATLRRRKRTVEL